MYTLEKRSTDHFDVIWKPDVSMSGAYPRMAGHISKRGTVYVAECGHIKIGEYSKKHYAYGAIKHYDATGQLIPRK